MGHTCLPRDNLKRQCGAIFFTKKTTYVNRFWNNKSGHLLTSNLKKILECKFAQIIDIINVEAE